MKGDALTSVAIARPSQSQTYSNNLVLKKPRYLSHMQVDNKKKVDNNSLYIMIMLYTSKEFKNAPLNLQGCYPLSFCKKFTVY